MDTAYALAVYRNAERNRQLRAERDRPAALEAERARRAAVKARREAQQG